MSSKSLGLVSHLWQSMCVANFTGTCVSQNNVLPSLPTCFLTHESHLFKTRASLVAQLVKNLPAMRETWARSLGEGKGYPLQCSGLENSMDCRVHGVAKSRTRLNNFHISLFKTLREFPGGLVVRIWHFHHRGWGSAPGQGTEILQAAWCCQKKKKKKLKL